jgi:hypothetical protein
VLPASTGGVPGRRRARRVETGLIETVGRREAAGAAVFNGGRVAPVVVDEGSWVLQLDRDPGVRRRRSIEGKSSSEGAQRRGGDSGGARQKFDVRERPPVAGGGGTSAETMGREAALERGAGAGSVTREWKSGGSAMFLEQARSAARLRGKRRGEPGGGVRPWGVPRGAGRVGAGSDRRAASRPRPGRGARGRAPAVGERRSEKREARRAWAGPGRKRVGRAQMNTMVLDLFKLIQMSSN